MPRLIRLVKAAPERSLTGSMRCSTVTSRRITNPAALELSRTRDVPAVCRVDVSVRKPKICPKKSRQSHYVAIGFGWGEGFLHQPTEVERMDEVVIVQEVSLLSRINHNRVRECVLASELTDGADKVCVGESSTRPSGLR